MALQVAQGSGFSRMPGASGPKVVYVKMVARDFFNPVSFAIKPLVIANPDGFPVDKPSSSGGAAANETGYNGAQASLDISQAMKAQGMDWLASVYIDNSQGAGVTVLRHQASGLTITAPPFTQGHYPLLIPSGQLFTFDICYIDSQGDNLVNLPSFGTYPDTSTDISGAGGIFYGANVESGFLRFAFTDVIVPPMQWNTRNWQTAIWYDFPTTITTGGTFQQVLGKNPFRKGLLIGNQGAATESLSVSLHQDNETDTTAASLTLSPGQFYQQIGPPAYIGAVRVTAATAGHVVVVKEFQ